MNWPQNYLSNTGPDAQSLATLGWVAIAVFSVVAIIVWALLAWSIRRREGSLSEHAPVGLEDGKSWVIIGGYLIPSVILAVIFGLTLRTMQGHAMMHVPQPSDALPLIRVTAHQWWFDAEYIGARPDLNFVAPTEIHVPTGCAVDLELRTKDVIHSFWVPKLNGKVDLVPGQVNRIRIHAERPGIYEGECSEYCGMQHAHMRVRIVAEPPEQFRAWLAQQRSPAIATVNGEAARGQIAFQSTACPLCHTIRGTASRGSVGPDLTHLASRGRIAGGVLDNDPAHLAEWISHAQSIKPGSQMPDMPQLDGEDLQLTVAYLRSLR